MSITRRWLNVKVKSTRYGDIATLYNYAGQTIQGISVPTYPQVYNSIECGGPVQHYLNVVKSGTAAKNNCSLTQIGSVVTYVVNAGKYLSIISQAAADALAEADVTSNKQAYANANGTCI